MVETLAPQGYAGRMRITLAACATFAVGALAGRRDHVRRPGAARPGARRGRPPRSRWRPRIALAAAIGEARGARILPQVRRQVPESWRRRLPVPLAAGLYGVLLGLGFTTFILTFAVWALAGVCVALGDPALGLAIGLAFGAGRLLPVVVLAPSAAPAGAALHAAMAERPQILRSLRARRRRGAGGVRGRAGGLMAEKLATNASDPSVDGRAARLARGRARPGCWSATVSRPRLRGAHPALGAGRLAVIDGSQIVVSARRPATGSSASVAAPGADAVAVSELVAGLARARGRPAT